MNADLASDLAERLAVAIGAAAVTVDPAARAELARDGLRGERAALAGQQAPELPLVVVQPSDTRAVAAVLAIARETGASVLPHGGGTGLMGGAYSIRAGIALDLRRLNRVLAINTEDRIARVQSGVVFAALNDALAPHGLICGHDPWTVPIATVGGAISTHGLGYLGGRYGSIGDQVLGLTVVLADGTVVETRPAERSATGPQLRRLWIGAEGSLGIVTEAVLRVFPIPEARRLHALDFPTFAAGYAAICAMAAINLCPAMVDYGGPAEQPGTRDAAGTTPARLNLAFEGFVEEVAAAEGRALAICAAEGGHMRSGGEAERFWNERHVGPERLQSWRAGEPRQPAPGTPGSATFEYLHCYLPQSQALPFLRQATAIFGEAGAEVVEWGLWNQPELISIVARAETATAAAVTEMRAACDQVLMRAQDLGGSMEYVHGPGLRFAHLMAREHGAGIAVLRRIKHALDPANLLNPGKLGLE